ncbi:MAG: trypsin-like serine protease [Phycisphaerales bacterium]|nr:trypsin-like serine protease [Phycisphaerales bacterium]
MRSIATAIVTSVALLVSAHGDDSASTAPTDVVLLKSGRRLEGSIVKRSDRRLWLDVGPDVIVFDMSDVGEVQNAVGESQAIRTVDSLFTTATDLPEMSPREHAKIIGPAVIKVSTPAGLGSGVIVNPEGYAITNAHVVQGETNLRTTIWLAQDDGTLKRMEIDDVELIAVNNQVDLALIRIKHPEGKPFLCAPVVLQDGLEIGQPVFAIGNPMGLERTMTQGVVSTTSRNFNGLTYIQTDTAINPGNSGGPLFNTRGEVVGITNMGIRGGESLGFAIPARYVKDFVRNREAFAFDKNNPNSGNNYLDPPPRKDFAPPSQLKDASGG